MRDGWFFKNILSRASRLVGKKPPRPSERADSDPACVRVAGTPDRPPADGPDAADGDVRLADAESNEGGVQTRGARTVPAAVLRRP